MGLGKHLQFACLKPDVHILVPIKLSTHDTNDQMERSPRSHMSLDEILQAEHALLHS